MLMNSAHQLKILEVLRKIKFAVVTSYFTECTLFHDVTV